MAKKRGAGAVAFSESVALLKKAGVEFCETIIAKNEKDAASAAIRLGFPVFVKVVSSPALAQAIHKAKSGFVAMVGSAELFSGAYGRLKAAHSALAKKKVVEQKFIVAVQKELSGVECIIGAKQDASFGPVVIFGSGGVLAEEFGDVSLRLCPVVESDALDMIKETKAFVRISKLKSGSLLLQKLADVIVNVSNLIAHSSISELDINPLIVNETSGKVVAVDVRAVRLSEAGGAKKAIRDWKSAAVSGFFNPSSIALIGASRDAESVGHAIMRNLTIGCFHRCEYCRPFLGKIYPVNPFATEILGISCYPSVLKIPEPVDLAIIAVPHGIVPSAVDECIRKKVGAVIIISAGFGEAGEEGKKLQDKIVGKLELARIPLLGPNCLGLIRLCQNLNASFGPSMPPKGGVAFVSQSGALADSIIDWSIQARYGLSALVSYGNKAMLDCYDFFEFLANDPETKSVAIYIEGVNNGRDFFEKLKALVARKPVVVLKGGRTNSGMKAAQTHTASLAGDAAIFRSAVIQSGAMLASTVEELFDMAKVLAEQPVCRGNGIAVITNGGGCGVICSDYCDEFGISLPELPKSVLSVFDKSGIMHPAYSRRNPLDIVGDALPNRYELAINTLLKEPYVNGLIVIQTLQAMTNSVLNAKTIVEAHKLFPDKPIISCFMGGRFSRKGMHYLDNMHIPDFNDIRKAVVAMNALIGWGKLVAAATPKPASPKNNSIMRKRKGK